MIFFTSIFRSELSDFYRLKEAELVADTLAHYRSTLLEFDKHLAENGVEEKVLTEQTISGWMKSLSARRRTMANKVNRIQLFTKYLNSVGIKAFVPELPKSANDYIPYLFSDDEQTRIFMSVDNINKTGNRSKCPYIKFEFPMLVRMLYGCGLRLGEALSIKVKDVDFDGGILIMKHTKGDKQRLVPMHSSLTLLLEKYCHAMGLMAKPDAPLFPGVSLDVPMKQHVARSKFNHTLKLTNIDQYEKLKQERGACLHCFRHVFAFKSFAQAERNGRAIDDSIPYLSTYLGHESLNETAKYLRFSSDLFPEALERFEEYTVDVFPEVPNHEEE